jgi:hypothetical protein
MKTASMTEAKVPARLETTIEETRVNGIFELLSDTKRNSNAIIGKPIHRKIMTLDL